MSSTTDSPKQCATCFTSSDSNTNEKMRSLSLVDLPRFLFRVSDDASPGITTVDEVASEAAKHHPEQVQPDLFLLEKKEAADLVSAHLMGGYKSCNVAGDVSDDKRPLCNLVSWTSSLLYALHYAHFRHKSVSKAPLDEMRILVVDTTKLPPGTFARDLEVIAAYKDHESRKKSRQPLDVLFRWRLSGSYIYGEYLSQGRLALDSSLACQVTIQELINRGLYHVNLHFLMDRIWDTVRVRINELRHCIAMDCRPFFEPFMWAFVKIGQAFKGFELPMTIYVFALAGNTLRGNGSLLYRTLSDAFSDDEISALKDTLPLGPDLLKIPELGRCTLAIDELCKEIERRKRVAEGKEPMTELESMISRLDPALTFEIVDD